MSMMIVKGYISTIKHIDIDIQYSIHIVLKNGFQDYFPNSEITKNMDRLILDIYNSLNMFFNLPIGVIVKQLGKIIDRYITSIYEYYYGDIGIIIADRIVKAVTILELVEKQKRG